MSNKRPVIPATKRPRDSAEVRELRALLKEAALFLGGGRGHVTPERLNAMRVGAGMKPCAIAGEEHAPRLLDLLLATTEHLTEEQIAKRLGWTRNRTSDAIMYLERHKKITATVPRATMHWMGPGGTWTATR
jgi:DNA-binding GntR family transcriptional regulator